MKPKLCLQLFVALFAIGSFASADTFFVADFGVNSITKYDADGNASPFTNEFVNGPYGIALDSSGNLYVSTNSNVIRKFAPGGTDLGVFASTGVNNAAGLAFDPSGNLFVANYGSNTVEKFAPDGTDLGVFKYLIGPTGIAFDASGNLYVAIAGNTIARFNPDGIPLSSFTSLDLNNPEGLAFDSLGNLYVANKAGNSITVFSPAGADLGTIVSANLSGPLGLAFDTDDNLYVVNSLSATIEKLAPNGTDSIFASTGFSPGFIAVQRTPTLVNISTRLNVLTGENVLDAGFIVLGSGSKTLLIRGLGPSLGGSDVDGALADPIIELHSAATGDIIASNDNWKNNQRTEIEATGIPPTNDNEAALITTLQAGSYTVIERGKQEGTGIGLVEVYDLGSGFGPELANISTRGFVDTADNVMIAGFIVASSTRGTGNVIVRAIGPSLADANVGNPLLDPTLEIHDSNGTVLAFNDAWKSDQQTEIEATGIPPTDDAESAVVLPLGPGAYTVIEAGKNGTSGVGLVEVYNLH
jgi:sugar lactone lactonase YvrE